MIFINAPNKVETKRPFVFFAEVYIVPKNTANVLNTYPISKISEIYKSAGRAGRSYHAAAKCGKFPKISLDMNGDQVAQHEGSGQLLIIGSISDRVCYYRHRYGNSLISAAGVAHSSKSAAGHTCIGGRCSKGHRIAQEVASENFLVLFKTYGIAYLQAISTFQSLLGECQIKGA